MQSVFEALTLGYLKKIHRRLDMIDDSVKTLVTAVAGIGVIVNRLSADVNAVVTKLSTTALHPLDAEDKAAIDGATQDLQLVAAKLAALDHALTPPPEPTGPTGV